MFRSTLASLTISVLGVFSLPLQAENLTQLTDPTRPAIVVAKSPQLKQATERNLKLTSVLVSNSRKVAIINGHIYIEGETAKGITVARIKRDQVWVQTADKTTVVLEFKANAISKVSRHRRVPLPEKTPEEVADKSSRLDVADRGK